MLMSQRSFVGSSRLFLPPLDSNDPITTSCEGDDYEETCDDDDYFSSSQGGASPSNAGDSTPPAELDDLAVHDSGVHTLAVHNLGLGWVGDRKRKASYMENFSSFSSSPPPSSSSSASILPFSQTDPILSPRSFLLFGSSDTDSSLSHESKPSKKFRTGTNADEDAVQGAGDVRDLDVGSELKNRSNDSAHDANRTSERSEVCRDVKPSEHTETASNVDPNGNVRIDTSCTVAVQAVSEETIGSEDSEEIDKKRECEEDNEIGSPPYFCLGPPLIPLDDLEINEVDLPSSSSSLQENDDDNNDDEMNEEDRNNSDVRTTAAVTTILPVSNTTEQTESVLESQDTLDSLMNDLPNFDECDTRSVSRAREALEKEYDSKINYLFESWLVALSNDVLTQQLLALRSDNRRFLTQLSVVREQVKLDFAEPNSPDLKMIESSPSHLSTSDSNPLVDNPLVDNPLVDTVGESVQADMKSRLVHETPNDDGSVKHGYLPAKGGDLQEVVQNVQIPQSNDDNVTMSYSNGSIIANESIIANDSIIANGCITANGSITAHESFMANEESTTQSDTSTIDTQQQWSYESFNRDSSKESYPSKEPFEDVYGSGCRESFLRQGVSAGMPIEQVEPIHEETAPIMRYHANHSWLQLGTFQETNPMDGSSFLPTSNIMDNNPWSSVVTSVPPPIDHSTSKRAAAKKLTFSRFTPLQGAPRSDNAETRAYASQLYRSYPSSTDDQLAHPNDERGRWLSQSDQRVSNSIYEGNGHNKWEAASDFIDGYNQTAYSDQASNTWHRSPLGSIDNQFSSSKSSAHVEDALFNGDQTYYNGEVMNDRSHMIDHTSRIYGGEVPYQHSNDQGVDSHLNQSSYYSNDMYRLSPDTPPQQTGMYGTGAVASQQRIGPSRFRKSRTSFWRSPATGQSQNGMTSSNGVYNQWRDRPQLPGYAELPAAIAPSPMPPSCRSSRRTSGSSRHAQESSVVDSSDIESAAVFLATMEEQCSQGRDSVQYVCGLDNSDPFHRSQPSNGDSRSDRTPNRKTAFNGANYSGDAWKGNPYRAEDARECNRVERHSTSEKQEVLNLLCGSSSRDSVPEVPFENKSAVSTSWAVEEAHSANQQPSHQRFNNFCSSGVDDSQMFNSIFSADDISNNPTAQMFPGLDGKEDPPPMHNYNNNTARVVDQEIHSKGSSVGLTQMSSTKSSHRRSRRRRSSSCGSDRSYERRSSSKYYGVSSCSSSTRRRHRSSRHRLDGHHDESSRSSSHHSRHWTDDRRRPDDNLNGQPRISNNSFVDQLQYWSNVGGYDQQKTTPNDNLWDHSQNYSTQPQQHELTNYTNQSGVTSFFAPL